MPLVSIDATEAYSQLKNNKEAFWPGRSADPTRLEPYCGPWFTPSFSLVPAEPVFTIGSCFARNIERHLRRLGYKTPTNDYVPQELVGLPLDGFMNKFTPHSMLNEVRWALAPEEAPDPAHSLIAQRDGTFIDGQLMSKIAVTHERGMERRREITDVFQKIRDCRVTVITLGLVEAWYDKKADLYLNRALPKDCAELEPGRFELHVLDYNELHSATRQLIKLILERGHPQSRIVLTVSPVPLTATFTDNDVVTANMYSKSVLRAVAEHIVREFDAVDYFPSYESVMLSDRNLTWLDDLVHVRDEIVSLNVARMAVAYAPSPAAADIARRLMPAQVLARLPAGF